MSVPTLLIAAPGSGQGKTTVTCALAAALQDRGLDVRLFKAGPDYLDPTHHQAITGTPSRNLDGWMMGKQGVLASFVRGTQGADIALIEGVMGLFDGRDSCSLEGSGAELAQWLGAPVVLVVDASGMARSAAALVEGFVNHVSEVWVAGAILNRVGSAKHTRIIADALRGVVCIGGLPKRPELSAPERHLGLVSGALCGLGARRAALSEWAQEHLDLDAVMQLATQASPGQGMPARLVQRPTRVRIGVAWDGAFHFYYQDNLELLQAEGAELVRFSPLADSRLPPELDGLLFGGGYPEEHAQALSENVTMRASVCALAATGAPVYGECGGLMYLGESLRDQRDRVYAMCGLLPVRTRMRERLRSLGYREATTRQDSILGPAGTHWRGHEFHYSELCEGSEPTALDWTGRWGSGRAGFVSGSVLGTYIHAHWGGTPELAKSFVRSCLEARCVR